MLDGAARLKDLFAEAARHGHAGAGDDRPRQRVRRLRLLEAGQGRRGQADHRHGGLLRHDRARRFDRQPGRVGADGRAGRRRRRLAGDGRYTHMTLLAETTEGMHNLFRLSSLASLEGYYYKPALRPRAARALRQGPHRAPPAARPARCRPLAADRATTTGALQAAADYRDIFGPGQLLLRADGPRPRHRAPHARRPPAARQRPRPAAASPPTTCTTPTPPTPRRTRCCSACSPARPWPTPTGSGSTPATSTSRPPQEMRHALARAARGLRQHPADRRALRRCRSPRAPT